jgi:hypothetical protein
MRITWYGAVALVSAFVFWQSLSADAIAVNCTSPASIAATESAAPDATAGMAKAQTNGAAKQNTARVPVAADLSGEWAGFYVQNGQRTPFTAQFSGRPGVFGGSTIESNSFADPTATHLYAIVCGHTTPDGVVTFVKTYDGTGGARHSVQYQGRIDETGRTITGVWVIGSTRGEFILARR